MVMKVILQIVVELAFVALAQQQQILDIDTW